MTWILIFLEELIVVCKNVDTSQKPEFNVNIFEF